MVIPKKAALWICIPLVVSAGILGVAAWKRTSTTPALQIEIEGSSLRADGRSAARIRLSSADGREVTPRGVTVEVVSGTNRAQIVRRGSGFLLHAGVLPGRVELEVRAPGYTAGRVQTELALEPADFDADGTPDVLKLDPSDQQAFRSWFTFLAEAPVFLAPERRPAEVKDCAALLRFAYREALREHNGEWAGRLALPTLPNSPSVQKYRYPYTLLGANLFRVREGRFQAEDLTDGSFAQFADAQTLQQLNSSFVSRDIQRAEPGDLLFYRQLEQDMPFHVMVLLGRSHFSVEAGPWVVYHTGPSGGSKGAMRRVHLAELLQHPEPRWRPVPGNRNFLGVYRWNILGGTE